MECAERMRSSTSLPSLRDKEGSLETKLKRRRKGQSWSGSVMMTSAAVAFFLALLRTTNAESILNSRVAFITAASTRHSSLFTLSSKYKQHQQQQRFPLRATSTPSSSSSSSPSASSSSSKATTKPNNKPKIQPMTPLTASPESRRRSVTKALQQASKPSTSSSPEDFINAINNAAAAWNTNTDDHDTTDATTDNNAAKTRPKGRPNSVPGAMSLTTTRRINNAAISSNPALPNALIEQENQIIAAPYAPSTSATTSDASPNTKKRKRGRPRKNQNIDENNKNDLVDNDDDSITKLSPLVSTTTTTVASSKPSKKTKKSTTAVNKSNKAISSTSASQPKKKRKQRTTAKTTGVSKNTGVTNTASSSSSTNNNNNIYQSTFSSSNNNNNSIKMNSNNNDKNGKDPLSLQRYYKTDLLSKEDEYALGMKIQFMVSCEAVHEGLSLELCREPSIVEWAYACGFTTPDPEMSSPNYVETGIDQSIRPSNSDSGGISGNTSVKNSASLIKSINPDNHDDDASSLPPQPEPSNMFVGNGLATAAGVGRGRGRVKKKPPTKLGDFYDDSNIDTTDVSSSTSLSNKKSKKTNKNTNKESDKDESNSSNTAPSSSSFQKPTYPNQKPINRGTARDFVELMLQGREAKQRMVQCNMRLVVSIARRYHNVGVNVQDLVQEGSLGLSRAAEKFDPKKGFKFSTYASWWIQQAVFRSIAYHSRTIRLPVHIHNLLNRMRRARQSLQQELGRVPSNEEVAAQLDMTTEKYNKILRMTRRSISLEMPKYQNNPKDMGHESEALVVDKIDSSEVLKDEQTPEQTVDVGLFQSDLKEMLKILGDDERRVISARYGLDDGLTRTVTAVAAQMNQSKSWVRSQECRALRKLRRPWYEKRLRDHQKSCSGLS